MMLNLRADEIQPGDVWRFGANQLRVLRVLRVKSLPDDPTTVRVYWSEVATGRPGFSDLRRDEMRMTDRST